MLDVTRYTKLNIGGGYANIWYFYEIMRAKLLIVALISSEKTATIHNYQIKHR